MTTIGTTAITVELPEAFDPRWSRLPGIQVDGRRITIDPAEYFFRFESNTWLVADWELVKSKLLDVDETTESAVEQLALDFIKQHGESTSDAARVLATAQITARPPADAPRGGHAHGAQQGRDFPADGPEGWIFTAPQGGPVVYTHFMDGSWRPACAKAGIPKGTGPHALRHHYASLLIKHGESVKTVSERLGTPTRP